MIDWLISTLRALPPEIATAIMSMLPIVEIQLGLPVAIEVYHLPIPTAYISAVLGNSITPIIIYFLIGPVSVLLSRKSTRMRLFFEWLFARTRKKFEQSKYLKYELIALILFIGIPLPLAGAWTGSVAAWLFGMKPRYAIAGIILGNLYAGIIVLILTLGIGTTIRAFF